LQYNERAFQKLKHPLFNGRPTYGGRSPFERFESLAKGNSPSWAGELGRPSWCSLGPSQS